MGSHWLFLLLVLQPATAQESCNSAADPCAEGMGPVVESRSMLALKGVSKVLAEVDDQSETEANYSMQTRPSGGQDYYRLTLKAGGECLDLDTNSGNLIIYSCHNNNNQKWYWEGQQLRSAYNQQCITKKGKDKTLKVEPCKSLGSKGSNDQHLQWNFDRTWGVCDSEIWMWCRWIWMDCPDGFGSTRSWRKGKKDCETARLQFKSGNCMDRRWGNNHVIAWDCGEQSNQQWRPAKWKEVSR